MKDLILKLSHYWERRILDSSSPCGRAKRLVRRAVALGCTKMEMDLLMTADKQALLAEERNLRRLSRAMDVAATLLWRIDLTLDQARDVVEHAKRTALQLFPDKEETFALIYGSRFRRILSEKYRLI